jgi:predicted kinase
MRSQVVMLCGPPGSGKPTYSKTREASCLIRLSIEQGRELGFGHGGRHGHFSLYAGPS